jgi:hypothetical protein
MEPLSASLIARAHLDAPTYSRQAHVLAQVAQTQRDAAAKDEYTRLLADAPTGHRRALERGKDRGAWLTAYPSYWNGTELSAEEFRDNPRLRFAIAAQKQLAKLLAIKWGRA